VAAGDSKPVHFTLSPRDLSSVTEEGDRRVAAGSYELTVGGGQPGGKAPNAKTRFRVTGEQNLPE